MEGEPPLRDESSEMTREELYPSFATMGIAFTTIPLVGDPRAARELESTIRRHFYLRFSATRRPLASLPAAAFDLLLSRIEHSKGGSSRQKIYEPLGSGSMLLILSSSTHSRLTKNTGVVCTRQRSSKRNLKKGRPLRRIESIISELAISSYLIDNCLALCNL